VTDTLEHRPPGSADYAPYLEDALGFLAWGMTAEGLKAHAANAFYVKRFSMGTGIPVQQAYEYLLAVAGAIGALEDKGLTREAAYSRAGLDKQHGPFPGPDDLHVA
jgi:hypothetical protein